MNLRSQLKIEPDFAQGYIPQEGQDRSFIYFFKDKAIKLTSNAIIERKSQISKGRYCSMKKGFVGFPILISALIAVGCSQSIGPSKKDIVKSYQSQIDKNTEKLKQQQSILYKLSSFNIEETENQGTKTQPEIHSRYKAALKVDESTLNNKEKKELKEMGFLGKDIFIVHGIAVSERSGDDWETEFKVEKAQNLIEDLSP